MKDLDIVFNIDYPSEESVGPLHEDLPKYVEYICVNDMAQFRRLVSALMDTIVCYIWVHPSLNSKRVGRGMKSDVEVNSIPELTKLNIEFKKITRSSQKSNNKDIFDTNEMLEFKKGMKYYTVRELNRILFPSNDNQHSSLIRDRLKDSLSADVATANVRLLAIRKYLAKAWSDHDTDNWYSDLITGRTTDLNELFGSRYWRFPISKIKYYLALSNLESDMIDADVTEVKDIILFDHQKLKWQIDLSFFNETSARFELMGRHNYRDKLMVASCLYIIHEAVHKIHNLDNNTVQGIGNFPRIIEEADYQADAIAMMIELGFFVDQNNGIENLTLIQVGEKLCETIKIAIETTFSFNPINEPLKRIQVRRVNRYLIWFWQYFRIQASMKTAKSTNDFIKQVLLLLSVKPNVEVTGPAIISNENLDRTFYDLDDIKHKELLGIMLENNQIIRLAPTENIHFQKLYSGMKESDFDKMLEFLSKVLSNYRSALDFEL